MAASSASPDFTHYPLLWLGICFAVGIFGANYFPLQHEVVLATCTAFAISAALFIKRTFSFIFLSIAFIASGFFSFQIQNNSVAENRLKKIYDEGRIASSEPVEIEGVVLGKPEPAFDGFFLQIETEQIVHSGGSRQNVSANCVCSLRYKASRPQPNTKNSICNMAHVFAWLAIPNVKTDT